MSAFDKAFGIVIGEEGGYTWNKDDPGGETNWGITAVTLSTAIAKKLIPNTTVKNLTQEQAKIIYKSLYWDVVHGDELPEPLCVYMFDCAVNQGYEPAIKMLQRALNVPQDGRIGLSTVAALKKATKWHFARFMAFRAMRYASTRNADKFGEGWLTRLFSVTDEAAK